MCEIDPYIQTKVVALLAKNAVLLDVGSLELISNTSTFSLFVVDDLSQWARLWELALRLSSVAHSHVDTKGRLKRKNGPEIINDDQENTIYRRSKKANKNLPAKTMHLFDPGQIQYSLQELVNKPTSLLVSEANPERQKKKGNSRKERDLEDVITKPVYNIFSDLTVHHTAETPCIPVLQYDSPLLHQIYKRYSLQV